MELNDYIAQIAELQKELDKVMGENKLLQNKLDSLFTWQHRSVQEPLTRLQTLNTILERRHQF